MDWVKIILGISLIIQEIQIILINKRLDTLENLLGMLAIDKIKNIAMISLDNEEDKDKGD